MRAAVEALREATARLARERTPLLQLRPRAISVEEAGRGADWDFLARPADVLAVKRAFLDAAKAARRSLSLHENPSKTKLSLWDAANERELAVDVWREHRLTAPGTGESRWLRLDDLSSALEARGGPPGLAADVEAALYVVHLENKRKDLGHPEVARRLSHYRGRLERGSEADRWLADLERGSAVAPIASAALAWLAVRGLAGRSRAREDDLGPRLSNAIRRRVDARLPGPIVAFVGPDGCGKSTIIGRLEAELGERISVRVFKRFFRFNRVYSTIERFSRAYRTEDRNIADERFAPVLFPLAVIDYFRTLRRTAEPGKTIVLDRFFHDLLVRNVRIDGGETRLRRGGRLAGKLFPVPRCVVQLHCPPELLRERKNELSAETVAGYEAALEDLYLSRAPERYVHVSTAAPVEDCVRLVRRSLERLGPGGGAPS